MLSMKVLLLNLMGYKIKGAKKLGTIVLTKSSVSLWES